MPSLPGIGAGLQPRPHLPWQEGSLQASLAQAAWPELKTVKTCVAIHSTGPLPRQVDWPVSRSFMSKGEGGSEKGVPCPLKGARMGHSPGALNGEGEKGLLFVQELSRHRSPCPGAVEEASGQMENSLFLPHPHSAPGPPCEEQRRLPCKVW